MADKLARFRTAAAVAARRVWAATLVMGTFVCWAAAVEWVGRLEILAEFRGVTRSIVTIGTMFAFGYLALPLVFRRIFFHRPTQRSVSPFHDELVLLARWIKATLKRLVPAAEAEADAKRPKPLTLTMPRAVLIGLIAIALGVASGQYLIAAMTLLSSTMTPAG